MATEQRGRLQGLAENLAGGTNASAGVTGATLLENTSLQVLAKVDPVTAAAKAGAEAGVQFLKSGKVPKEIKKVVTISGPVLVFNSES